MLPYSAVDLTAALRRTIVPDFPGRASNRPDQSPPRSTLLASLRDRLAALILA